MSIFYVMDGHTRDEKSITYCQGKQHTNTLEVSLFSSRLLQRWQKVSVCVKGVMNKEEIIQIK